jgi:hypothetical protein
MRPVVLRWADGLPCIHMMKLPCPTVPYLAWRVACLAPSP